MAGTVLVQPSRHSFEYTATGILGDKRNTMLSNELHLRSELGKSKGHGHKIIKDPSYVYGRANHPDDQGVAGALVWRQVDGTQDQKLRRKSRKQKKNEAFGDPVRPCTPINDVLTFKFQNDWIEEQSKLQKAKTAEARSKVNPFNPNMAYSNKSRVIPGSYRETHTSTLRLSMREPDTLNESLWQMSKFSRHAAPRVDTFRSESSRESAVKISE